MGDKQRDNSPIHSLNAELVAVYFGRGIQRDNVLCLHGFAVGNNTYNVIAWCFATIDTYSVNGCKLQAERQLFQSAVSHLKHRGRYSILRNHHIPTL